MRIAWIIKDGRINGGNRAVCETSRQMNALRVHSMVFCLERDAPLWPQYQADIKDIAELAAFAPDICIRTYFTVPLPLHLPAHAIPVQYIQANYDRDGTTSDPRADIMAAYLSAPNTVRIAVSHYLQSRLSARGITAHVAQPGVDHAQFAPQPRRDRAFRVLVEGSLKLTKAVRESYAVIPHDIETWGLGPEDHSLGAARMFVLPKQESLSSIYSHCNAIIKLAAKEGHPLVLLEAMACGCVPICGNDGGHLDFCVDGFNSRVCINAEEAADAVSELKSDSEYLSFLSQNAVRTASAYSWKRTATRILKILRASRSPP